MFFLVALRFWENCKQKSSCSDRSWHIQHQNKHINQRASEQNRKTRKIRNFSVHFPNFSTLFNALFMRLLMLVSEREVFFFLPNISLKNFNGFNPNSVKMFWTALLAATAAVPRQKLQTLVYFFRRNLFSSSLCEWRRQLGKFMLVGIKSSIEFFFSAEISVSD